MTKKIKQLRMQKGLSQTELSALIKVTPQSISAFEKGTAKPSAETLMLLSKELGVSIEYLITDESEKVLNEKITHSTGVPYVEVVANLNHIIDEKDKQIDSKDKQIAQLQNQLSTMLEIVGK